MATIGPASVSTIGLLPAVEQWNPSRYAVEGNPQAAVLAGGAPSSGMGYNMQTIISIVVLIAIIWLLAERHIALRARASGAVT